MDKFKISQLRDYFLKTGADVGNSYKDLSKEDLLGLAILSVFDKKGQVVEGKNYSYERPDGVIDEKELNITKKDYEKAIKQISKQLKKETNKEITSLKMPSYEDLQAMMENDKKIDLKELKTFATTGVIRAESSPKPDPVLVPEKTGTNTLTDDEKVEFVNNAMINNESEIYRIQDMVEAAEKAGKTTIDLGSIVGTVQACQNIIDNFKPSDDVAFNMQDGLDGKQFNDNGQMITRINNHAGFYEKYKYDSPEDKNYSEMMRYKGNGYKAEYWRYETLKDANGTTFKGKVQYILDENEKIYKIALPPNAAKNQEVEDFNAYMLYNKVLQYDSELQESEQ